MATAVDAALQAMQQLGGAVVGDKTLIDALAPFAESLRAAAADGADLTEAWQTAATVAVACADATSAMTARRGRAAWLAERSIGTPDPGALSFAAAMTAAAQTLADTAAAP